MRRAIETRGCDLVDVTGTLIDATKCRLLANEVLVNFDATPEHEELLALDLESAIQNFLEQEGLV